MMSTGKLKFVVANNNITFVFKGSNKTAHSFSIVGLVMNSDVACQSVQLGFIDIAKTPHCEWVFENT